MDIDTIEEFLGYYLMILPIIAAVFFYAAFALLPIYVIVKIIEKIRNIKNQNKNHYR